MQSRSGRESSRSSSGFAEGWTLGRIPILVPECIYLTVVRLFFRNVAFFINHFSQRTFNAQAARTSPKSKTPAGTAESGGGVLVDGVLVDWGRGNTRQDTRCHIEASVLNFGKCNWLSKFKLRGIGDASATSARGGTGSDLTG